MTHSYLTTSKNPMNNVGALSQFNEVNKNPELYSPMRLHKTSAQHKTYTYIFCTIASS